jgi:hypothetical protein
MTERYRIVAKIAVFWPTSAPFVAIRDRLLSNVRLAKWVAAVREAFLLAGGWLLPWKMATARRKAARQMAGRR